MFAFSPERRDHEVIKDRRDHRDHRSASVPGAFFIVYYEVCLLIQGVGFTTDEEPTVRTICHTN